MNSVYWKTLILVAETRSFSRAADRLCVTQSAVSRRVQFLEERFGAELVDRSGALLKLTSAGEVACERAREILAIESEVAARIVELNQRPKLNFGCTRAFGISRLPQVLRAFLLGASHRVEVSCSVGTSVQLLGDLANGTCDLAAIDHCAALDLGQLAYTRLPAQQLAFICSADLGLRPGDATLRQLLGHTLVIRSEGSCSRRLLESGLAAAGLDLDAFRMVVVVDELSVTAQMLADGGVVTLMSREVLSGVPAAANVTFHTVPGFHQTLLRSLVRGVRPHAYGTLPAFEWAVMQSLAAARHPEAAGQ